jgi:hypothetical protein
MTRKMAAFVLVAGLVTFIASVGATSSGPVAATTTPASAIKIAVTGVPAAPSPACPAAQVSWVQASSSQAFSSQAFTAAEEPDGLRCVCALGVNCCGDNPNLPTKCGKNFQCACGECQWPGATADAGTANKTQ